jgi:hypothetical protein
VVEWNPPDDRPRLADAMRWPASNGFCTIKIIEVPHAVHCRLKGSESLPLYQMIGKNVGIRRARGRFILCTNIDIIFSHALVQFIASRALEPNRGYRVVRYDVAPGFPQNVDADALLRYCESHLIRGHFPNGSVPVEPDGTPALFENDIVEPGAGIRFGRGWHMREGGRGVAPFRWVEDCAEILVLHRMDASRRLSFTLEPNRYDPSIPVTIAFGDESGRTLSRVTITEPSTIAIDVPPGPAGRHLQLKLENPAALDAALRPVYENRSQLRYVVRQVAWSAQEPAGGGTPVALPAVEPTVPLAIEDFEKALDTVPLVDVRRGAVRVVTLAAHDSYALYYPFLRATRDGVHAIRLRYRIVNGEIVLGPLSHDGLWWREHQMTRSRRDLDAVIDVSIALKAGEDFRLVVYNQHPEGDRPSEVEIHELTVSDGIALSSPRGAGRARSLFGRAFRRHVPDRAQDAVKSAISRAMLPLVEWHFGDTLAEQIYGRLQEERRLSKEATLALVDSNDHLARRVAELEPLTDVAAVYGFLRRVHPDSLNANACGDFLLMAREHWFELRGYAEFEMYSMNIDGLFTYTAHYGGAPEERLDGAMRIYHMEHAAGSGWTPEGEAKLRQRMQEGGVDWLDWQTVSLWISYMHWLERPMIFNAERWGYADVELPETIVTR